MNSVLTPAAWAWATIEATLPPSESLMYQIHMPWPSKALRSRRRRRRAAGSRRRRRVQRVVVDVDRPVGARVAPWLSRIMMCPEWALAGTVAHAGRRRSGAGARPASCCVMRGPGALGKATTMPALQTPAFNSSVPCIETWRGLPLHFALGHAAHARDAYEVYVQRSRRPALTARPRPDACRPPWRAAAGAGAQRRRAEQQSREGRR